MALPPDNALSVDTAAEKKKKSLKHTLAPFISGGVAGCGAATFTNPWEVVKTRLQLQGELVRAGGLTAASRPYHNSFQAMRLVFQNEGIRGCQRGLGVAYAYQLCLNGSRIGFYEPVYKETIHRLSLSSDHGLVAAGVFAGAFAGMMGAVIGSPFYLIKTRQQAYSPVFRDIGYQHEIKSSLSALTGLWRTDGMRGLYRGVTAAMFRAGVGSSVQMPSYTFGKASLISKFGMQDSIGTHFGASVIAGILACVAMNPFDVVSTRIYNQGVDPATGRGLLYKNPVDCLVKVVTTEGVFGLYKGFFAHFLRIGPHTMIMFVLMEQLKPLFV
ncbi:mitochondrial carrier domain-containing protein [Spinellus fusiger]|nr:mitochondrial carrier domain-containing protein [Spinellus fusiger]